MSCLNAPLPANAAEVRFFAREIHPVLKEYCLPCHSTSKHKGDLDLERFSSLDLVKQHPKVWQLVAEQLANNEMPPKEKPQPSPAEKKRLSDWVHDTLDRIAREHAGDPGPVVLRRLSNAEYTYTLRDLTGIDSLQPAREFPVDGAAGEGFMNTGQALVMSPSLLTKYLDAGKDIASHAMLLPDGIRFSSAITRRDWTEEILGQIRGFYRQYTDPGGGNKVNLQGIVFETNEGGRLPLEKYLTATIDERNSLASGRKNVAQVARERGLSARYLTALMTMLMGREPSLLLDSVRARWRAARPGDAPFLAADIAQWQKSLWKFNSVGHIGKVGGPKAWMEPVNPLIAKQEVRIKIPAPSDGPAVTVYLVASDAGDGNENDFVVWERPRLVAPGRPDLLLRDVRGVSRNFSERRAQIFGSTAKYLAAAAEATAAPAEIDVTELARRHGVEAAALSAWLYYLGIGSNGPVTIASYFTNRLLRASNYDFIRGWGSSDTPLLVANSSDQHVRIPGNMKPHSVAVHPSAKLQAAVGWRSPITDTIRAEAKITHAHPECGNGITWSLELRRGSARRTLAAGTAQGGKEITVGPIENLAVRPGDLVSVLVGPRDGNHSCDLTAVNLVLTGSGPDARRWDLEADVSGDVLAGNPHADRFGNEGVWYFYTEPDKGRNASAPGVPDSSLLTKWEQASGGNDREKAADAVQTLLLSGPSQGPDSPDTRLYRQLASFGGPLFPAAQTETIIPAPAGSVASTVWGPDPGLFGRRPDGKPIEESSLCARAPSMMEIRLPADLAVGCELVMTGVLEKETGREGSVQLRVLTTKPEPAVGLLPSPVTMTENNGVWTGDNRRISLGTPVLVNEGSAARRRLEAAFDEFRQIFPAALCYSRIVPVDEVVTLTLFHREDNQLARLMLDADQRATLDRLWDELHYVSHDALTLVDAFAQLMEYATQDGDPKVFEPLRGPIHERAAAFRQRLLDAEPKHLDGVMEFAGRAYRHPLADAEKDELRRLYAKLRGQELPHDQAIRLVLARVLVAPAFLYRAENPGPRSTQAPVNNWELASRLSYFLWSSMPDAELREVAAAGKLRNPGVLAAQTRRMLGDARVRRLATEFASQWLHIHDFDTLDEKSERHFPTFSGLRSAMYEESILFFTDFFQRDRPVREILDADYTFLNGPLAAHYGIPGVTGEEWKRVDGVRQFSRGGILGEAATLAKQSGASRTSPILRGNWVAETLLGDKLPRPPKDVPRLPEDEATESLTVRQLTEKHSADPRCATCHVRMDAFGFTLEGFDAIGRHRERDLGDRPVDTRARVMDGTEIEGIEGLRNYLLTKKHEAYMRQFCRKLLGYALGRGVQLSDEPLLKEMQAQLRMKNDRVSAAIETVVRSRQFREIRGREMSDDN